MVFLCKGQVKSTSFGIGPGTEDYLLPVARKEIEASDCLIGGKRALRLFRHLHKEEVLLDGNFEKVIPFLLKEREKKKIALLVSGDPGLYSFLNTIFPFSKKRRIRRPAWHQYRPDRLCENR